MKYNKKLQNLTIYKHVKPIFPTIKFFTDLFLFMDFRYFEGFQ